jgi:hypothetical protein
MSRNNREYQICKNIALYMKLQYPSVLYHFDLTGLSLSIAQAGMSKAIQCGRGWPDFFIAGVSRRKICGEVVEFLGLFIEVKAEGTKLYKKDGVTYITDHIKEQRKILTELNSLGYMAYFGIGFDHCKVLIDEYLNFNK